MQRGKLRDKISSLDIARPNLRWPLGWPQCEHIKPNLLLHLF